MDYLQLALLVLKLIAENGNYFSAAFLPVPNRPSIGSVTLANGKYFLAKLNLGYFALRRVCGSHGIST